MGRVQSVMERLRANAMAAENAGWGPDLLEATGVLPAPDEGDVPEDLKEFAAGL